MVTKYVQSIGEQFDAGRAVNVQMGNTRPGTPILTDAFLPPCAPDHLKFNLVLGN